MIYGVTHESADSCNPTNVCHKSAWTAMRRKSGDARGSGSDFAIYGAFVAGDGERSAILDDLSDDSSDARKLGRIRFRALMRAEKDQQDSRTCLITPSADIIVEGGGGEKRSYPQLGRSAANSRFRPRENFARSASSIPLPLSRRERFLRTSFPARLPYRSAVRFLSVKPFIERNLAISGTCRRHSCALRALNERYSTVLVHPLRR